MTAGVKFDYTESILNTQKIELCWSAAEKAPPSRARAALPEDPDSQHPHSGSQPSVRKFQRI